MQQKIPLAVRQINENLKKVIALAGINKITMHFVRHIFENISGDKISILKIQRLYRHITFTTTIAYQAYLYIMMLIYVPSFLVCWLNSYERVHIVK